MVLDRFKHLNGIHVRGDQEAHLSQSRILLEELRAEMGVFVPT